MCTYYYLHYHHVAPCSRGVEYAVQYSFCENSTIEAMVGRGDSPLRPAVSSTGMDTGMNMSMSMSMTMSMGMGNNNSSNSNNSSSSPLGSTEAEHQQQQQQQQQVVVQQQPCEDITPAPEYSPAIAMAMDMGMGMAIDYTNPCATGGCFESQHCASGGCRLDELGGRWVCCRCGRGGNAFRWCVHPVRKVPDTLCYHVVCRDCRMDG